MDGITTTDLHTIGQFWNNAKKLHEWNYAFN